MALINKLTAIANAIRAKTGSSGTLTLDQMATAIANINGFEADVTFNAVNSTASAYLTASASYSADDYTETVADDYSSTTTRHDLPATQSLTAPTGAADYTIIDRVSGCWWTEAVSGSTVTVKNLIPNRPYYYFFRNSSGEMISAGQIKATGALRMIDGNTPNGIGVFNIRDIGGRACDGGTLKYGKIYRGCQLNSIYTTAAPDSVQKALFKDLLGIRDDIDLRSVSETAGQDRQPGTADDFTESALGKDVDYIWIPIAPYATGVKLTDASQTAYYKTLIQRIIFDIVNNKPCYIHCAEGADRTGTIIALIEALCGVGQTDIDRGYELTSLAQNRERLRTSADWIGLINYINTLDGDSFRDKVVYYALQAGVNIGEINALRHALIDGNPADIEPPVTTTYTISVSTSSHTHINNSDTTISEGDSYTANVSADTDYAASVIVTMGGVDITATAYNSGVISIASVTGNIVITISEKYVGNMFDPTTATDSARINSSGNAVAAAANQLVTDFIPVTGSDTIRLISDKAQNTNTYTGMVALYDSSKTYLGNAYHSSIAWTWNAAETEGTFDVSVLSFSNNATYARLCIAYTSMNNIEIYVEG